jgi:uncharacterized membrane protein
MKTLQLISLITASTFIFSCSKSGDTPATNPVVTVTYQKDIKGLMATNCTGCHSATAPVATRTTPYLETYDQVKNNIVTITQEINLPSGQGMPPTQKLPQATIDLVKAWVTQGSVN